MILQNLYNKVLGFFRQTEQEETESSKDTACNRLRVVLMQDRTNLTPELMERMRKEMVELLSKYVEMAKEDAKKEAETEEVSEDDTDDDEEKVVVEETEIVLNEESLDDDMSDDDFEEETDEESDDDDKDEE